MRHSPRSLSLFLLLGMALPAQLAVVATQPDLADLAKRIGGPDVEVSSLTSGREDLHLVNVTPSMLIKLRRADVFIELGLDAEHSWVPELLRTARNKDIGPAGPGFVNASAGITPRNIPSDRTRGAGPDVHPRGNPHYNLDPEGIRAAARNIKDGLTRVLPEKRQEFEQRLRSFEEELDARLGKWREALAPHRGAPIIEHHDAWVYFAARFDLRIVARLEPKPGMAPTPAHLRDVIRTAKEEKVQLILARPANEDIAEKVAKAAGAKVAVLPLSSSTEGEHVGWFAYMDHVVGTMARALSGER